MATRYNSQNRRTCPWMRTHCPKLNQWLCQPLGPARGGAEDFWGLSTCPATHRPDNRLSRDGPPQQGRLSPFGTAPCWIVNMQPWVVEFPKHDLPHNRTLLYSLIICLAICLFFNRHAHYNFPQVLSDLPPLRIKSQKRIY